jgi:hypothetical protein
MLFPPLSASRIKSRSSPRLDVERLSIREAASGGSFPNSGHGTSIQRVTATLISLTTLSYRHRYFRCRMPDSSEV